MLTAPTRNKITVLSTVQIWSSLPEVYYKFDLARYSIYLIKLHSKVYNSLTYFTEGQGIFIMLVLIEHQRNKAL